MAENVLVDQLRVVTICTGNICRSPMAEVVLRDRVESSPLAGRVHVESAATTGWEVGSPMDPRARRVLRAAGYVDPAIDSHRARQVTARQLREADLVLAATHEHVRALRRVLGGEEAPQVRLVRAFDPASGEVDLDDPWYGDVPDFEDCLAQIEAAGDGVLAHLRALAEARRG